MKEKLNSPSSVENQTSVADKIERTSASREQIKQTPPTVKGQLAELVRAVRTRDDTSRDFLLRVVQPGLAGLMDGSVSTLAPIFATAFATHQPFTAFLVGMAAAPTAAMAARRLVDLSTSWLRARPRNRNSGAGPSTLVPGGSMRSRRALAAVSASPGSAAEQTMRISDPYGG